MGRWRESPSSCSGCTSSGWSCFSALKSRPPWRRVGPWEAPRRSAQLAIRGELAFGLLVALAENQDRGGTVGLYELGARLGTSPAIAEEHLTLMQRAGLVAATSDGGRGSPRN